MSDQETADAKAEAENQRFWTMPATQWDIFKFFLPLVLACSMWAVRVEVNQAKIDARFDKIAVVLDNQRDQFRDIQSVLKSLNDTKDERGQRLSRIEAKIDVLMGDRTVRDARGE